MQFEKLTKRRTEGRRQEAGGRRQEVVFLRFTGGGALLSRVALTLGQMAHKQEFIK
ncbi:MAG: hypothetical protein F6K41_26085 [Symploca sp. SIO3E6]|nr:hypothetical protein [Caldora sp. SIO3E6]